MPATYTLTKVNYQGEKPNPRKPSQALHKHKVTLTDGANQEFHDVYWQSVTEHHEGEEVYGDIEDGEYGPRFRTAQRDGNQGSSGGNFKAPSFERVPDNSDRSRRIERQHSQEMAIRVAVSTNLFGGADFSKTTAEARDVALNALRWLTDWFQQDLDADVGGGKSEVVGSRPTSSEPATADVSAGGPAVVAKDEQGNEVPTEASPAQKRKLTTLFNEAQIAREAQKAIVLYRCRSEKATKDGASQLITDLLEGATHDQLIAEVHDAARAGDAVAIRARKLIPSDTPVIEPEPEVVEPNGEKDIPF